jgi:hypothetical protein
MIDKVLWLHQGSHPSGRLNISWLRQLPGRFIPGEMFQEME